MRGSNPIYYWDSCLFIAWIKDEQRPSGEMDGVREVVDRVKKRNVTLITSVLTSVEVLSGSIPVGMDTFFKNFVRRVNQISVDPRVADLAHQIRNHYRNLGGKPLSTADAIHLATAIHYRATEFHTFDEKGRDKTLGLIPLSGNVGGHRLTICKPSAIQHSLDLKKALPPNNP